VGVHDRLEEALGVGDALVVLREPERSINRTVSGYSIAASWPNSTFSSPVMASS